MAGTIRRAIESLQAKHSGVSREFVINAEGDTEYAAADEDVESHANDSAGTTQQPLGDSKPVGMFRIRTLAIVLRCFACVLSAIQLWLVAWGSFQYYNDSNCLTKCRTFYDHPTHQFYIPKSFYDSDDQLLKPVNSTKNATDYGDSYDDLKRLPLALSGPHSRGGWRREMGSDWYHWNEIPEDVADVFAECQTQCDDFIMPMQGPLMIYIIHFCLTSGFILKTSYSSYLDYLAVRAYDAVEGLLLLIGLIILIAVHVDNRESDDALFIHFAYHHDVSRNWFSKLMVGAIVVGVACFVLHLAEAINHRIPPKSARYPDRNQGTVSFRFERLDNFWFPRVLKLVRCFVAVGGATGLALYLFHRYYAEDRNRWHYDSHFHEHVFLTFPAIAWHAVICCMIGSWNGRYLNKCQVQVELAFYIIELIHLSFLAWSHGMALMHYVVHPHDIGAPAITMSLINIVIWIFDFGVRRFPGHDCCNRKPL